MSTTLPMGTIIDHGVIRSSGDLARLGIIDMTRLPNNEYRMRTFDGVTRPFIDTTVFWVVQLDLTKYPNVPNFPIWKHVGTNHRYYAELYWNHFHAVYTGELKFHDMPDFSGTFVEDGQEIPFAGDVGLISPIAFRDAIGVGWGDTTKMWTSVLSDQIHVLLQAIQPADGDYQKAWENLQGINQDWHVCIDKIYIRRNEKNYLLGTVAEVANMRKGDLLQTISKVM